MNNATARRTVLIIDDEKPFCEAVRDYLQDDRTEVLSAQSGADGLRLCSERKVDVVLLDQKLPDGEGHSLAGAIHERNEQAKIIFITAFPSFENAVKAVRLGVHDYLSKPLDPAELRLSVGNALRTLELERIEQIQNYTREKERETAVLVGASRAFADFLQLVDSAAISPSPVLITGETGTGKNIAAKAIHFKGPSSSAPFLSINCAALPENLIEAELFGYEKGAFTGATAAKKGLFEMAEGGTIFLDEIGEIPIHLQSKMLSVIEDKAIRRVGGTTTKSVNVRIIAATNADLDHAVGKTFRKDLYYRLSVIRIHIPPLRERREDIPPLCSALLERIGEGRMVKIPEPEMTKLMAYDWPGNVRELGNVLERSLFLQKDGSSIHPSHLLERPVANALAPVGSGDTCILTLEQSEKDLITRALAALNGNVTQTAKALGISLSTLKRKIKEFGLK